MNEKTNPSIKRYSAKLGKSLKHLSRTDRDDIVREIEGHIIERWEADSTGRLDDESLRGVLGKMGTPEYIAAQYCEQRGWAKPTPGHPIRNAILIGMAIIAVAAVSIVYIGARYVVAPVLGVFHMTDKEGDFSINIGDLVMGRTLIEENKTATIPAQDIVNFELYGENGRITINGTADDSITVNYIKRIYGKNPEAAAGYANNVGIEQNKSGSTLTISSSIPGSKPDGISGAAIEYDVKLPKRLATKVRSSNGAIIVEGVDGRTDVNVSNGRVDINKIASDVNVETDNGRVDVKDVNGGVTAKTNNGRVEVDQVGGSVNVNTDNGSVSVKNVSKDIQVNTDNGRISIKLAKDSEFKFRGETDRGGVTTNFPTTKDGSVYLATVGKGTNSINVTTDNGSIEVR